MAHSNCGDRCGGSVCVIWDWKSLYVFVVRHLTNAWKEQYKTLSFRLAPQAEVDEVIRAAKKLIVSATNLHVPKVITPPRRRPVKHAGKLRKGCYNRGPESHKKRSYSCSLCHLEGHLARHLARRCHLRQLFDDRSA